MFHKSSLKLASLYLVIIMAISLFFSATVYRLSIQEFSRGILRPGPTLQRGQNISQQLQNELEAERQIRYDEAKARILNTLLLTNLAILIAAGGLSYVLARRTLKPIEQAHETLERFTADASHELRTPLAAMQSEAEVALMSKKLTVAQAKKVLESNLEEVERLTNLTAGLLRLAHSEAKVQEFENVEVNTLLLQATEQVRQRSDEKHIRLTPDIQDEVTVLGNRGSLVELFVIILDNAIKYSPDNSTVNIKAQTSGKFTSVMFTDSGKGIKPSEIPYIFDRFYRSDSARSKEDIGGYGLGLAIAKSIVGAHQGEITAKSSPKGTTIQVELPT